MLTRMVTTRRTMLRGAVVASAFVLTGGFSRTGTSPAAAAEPTGHILVTDESWFASAKHFDGSWSHTLHPRFPVQFRLADRAESLSLNAKWDARLFHVRGPGYATVGDTIRELDLTLDGDNSFSVSIAPDVSHVALHVESLTTYPNDAIADAVRTELALRSAGGAIVDQLAWTSTPAESMPWGVEVTVDWVSLNADVVPARVVIKSIGPNDAPSGLEFVGSYADVLALPTVTVPDGEEVAPAQLEEHSLNGLTGIKITTTRPLTASEQVEILFTSEPSDSIPTPFDGFVPYVRFSAPVESLDLRATGKHDAYPVTSSGSQLSSYLPAPSAG